ncbi:hypothetical protein FHR83_004417 [Actinoplanes campanulatus]|uniref:YbaB/EbfC DNA-binding family protein n=1 Tax=Actinoplanes campanulatus TaxID=113559 RepID=A0A7W5FFM4_9ACTN|nr:hypothetical protein [Actinoplanes campanulatus]MBB3096743.1 hypothetical protein [Actinoplanes campanulatus]GGN30991.1 hypothetical protein GCM10010109_51010 [Actinoplanes campanulatus]GID37286.1 hypothetical protein Aca09nite_37920 [Actinoplanes campanulatus]
MSELGGGWQDLWLGTATACTDRTAETAGRAKNRDGSISITVGSGGQLLSLDLDDRVRDLTGPQLAREILMVMRCAHAHIPAPAH